MQEILSIYNDQKHVARLMHWLGEKGVNIIHLKGLAGSSPAVVAACLLGESGRNHVFLLPDKESASYFHNDLSNLTGKDEILFFPSSYKRSVEYARKSSDNIILRTGVLRRLSQEEGSQVIVTYPEAMLEKTVTGEYLSENTFTVCRGDRLSLSFLSEFLENCRFMQVDYVYEPGQYSIRGSILDVFSYSAEKPDRIDFFGETVDSIRSFNIETQLSVEKLERTTLIPDVAGLQPESAGRGQGMISFVEFIGAVTGTGTTWWINDLAYVRDRMDDIYDRTLTGHPGPEGRAGEASKQDLLIDGKSFTSLLGQSSIIEFGHQVFFPPDQTLDFRTIPQPAFKKNFELLAEDLMLKQEAGYTLFILSDSQQQIDRILSIFDDIRAGIRIRPLLSTLHQGFIDHETRICLYTDHQIFDRYHRHRIQERFTRRETITMRDLTALHPGDYVVHIDHGIGQFGGMEKIRLNEREQEAVKLVYRDQDTLYVSIHSLHRISKYKGKDNEPPRIYKLGSGAWQKLKANTKKKVKDIARELINLYARRKTLEGFSFSPDSYLQTELEASFMYEDTEDQLKATRELKEGMEAGFPMDRLVCGDVGFGKTEVAIRGAFKAVSDSKQVAVLVPTTILALQHFKTFSERLRDFPCTVDYISRLKKPAAQRKTLADLASGRVDIIIGTHRLAGQDVMFRDLGMLIIDEEQKFGVAMKEKLRKMKLNVDTLTLTATPIPRTLQLSLMGARDLSIIRTPPPNRYPIVTELHSFNHEIIREAINYEIHRGGQVFFIHNRIQNIEEMEVLIHKLCPDMKIVVAHGQLEGSKLEKIMLGFIEGEYDVLISTAIIESGLDIPNANTIIINDAHHFGLSDLHQLRGRVGRSNRKAFCYLLAPPHNLLTAEARRRLNAIEAFSELGSGLNIAMQDLDIRGAGNLLGAEQSGFIAEIGFETYHRILDEAILELKENEFPEIYGRTGSESPDDREFVTDCQIDTDLSLLFPDAYIENGAERLRLYRLLDSIETGDGLGRFEQELQDRFGPIPDVTTELINVVRLRWMANRLGFEKIILKKGLMIMHFVSNPDASYYASATFKRVLAFVQEQGRQFRMKESSGKLTLSTDPVDSVSAAIGILQKI
jgi:transcription-repair coupling factor (superfamily II helicase)